MRGADTKQATMLSVLTPERRVPQDHPLRAVKKPADAALVEQLAGPKLARALHDRELFSPTV